MVTICPILFGSSTGDTIFSLQYQIVDRTIIVITIGTKSETFSNEWIIITLINVIPSIIIIRRWNMICEPTDYTCKMYKMEVWNIL